MKLIDILDTVTLGQKRKIVRAFKAGADMTLIALRIKWKLAIGLTDAHHAVEQVIRDYLNGKFQLPAKARKGE